MTYIIDNQMHKRKINELLLLKFAYKLILNIVKCCRL